LKISYKFSFWKSGPKPKTVSANLFSLCYFFLSELRAAKFYEEKNSLGSKWNELNSTTFASRIRLAVFFCCASPEKKRLKSILHFTWCIKSFKNSKKSFCSFVLNGPYSEIHQTIQNILLGTIRIAGVHHVASLFVH
jgi:hypothetical protein